MWLWEIKEQWEANKERFVHRLGQIKENWQKQTSHEGWRMSQQLNHKTKATMYSVNVLPQKNTAMTVTN